MSKHDHRTCDECVSRRERETERMKRLEVEAERLRQRLDDLAEKHSHWRFHKGYSVNFLTVREGEEFNVTPYGNPELKSPNGGRTQQSFYCEECRTPWPCRTYLWATGSEPFRVVLYPGLSPNGGFATAIDPDEEAQP